MEILNLEQGTAFSMGKGRNWRIVHPDMGARQITLNHGWHAPGQEFVQHVHGGSIEDLIVVLEGRGAMRQGDFYTPITAGEAILVPGGEVHGTVNTSEAFARFISFQSPPDMALYRGERNVEDSQIPLPRPGHASGVLIAAMAKGGPCFGAPGEWRTVFGSHNGARHVGLDYIRLPRGSSIEQRASAEEVWVVEQGALRATGGDAARPLAARDVLFLRGEDAVRLEAAGGEGAVVIRAYVVG
jgi:mannose-6-phosphate isomerase-like protein (cupin superfamily)